MMNMFKGDNFSHESRVIAQKKKERIATMQ